MPRNPPINTVAGLAVLAFCSVGQAQAGLLAYDGFDHATGSLVGKTGQLGFSSAYTAYGPGANVSSPGATFAGLPVTGNKIDLAGPCNGVFGILSNSPETPGTKVYFSYLLQVTSGTGCAGVSLFDGATETLYTGNHNSGGGNCFGLYPLSGSWNLSAASPAGLSLVVCRIDFAEASATIRLYVNPASNVEPSTADALITKDTALTYDRIRIASNAVTGTIDEFRLGQTFADVAMAPPQEILVLGSSVATGAISTPSEPGWAYRLKDLLETRAPNDPEARATWLVNNASVPGDTTAKVLNRFQTDVVTAHPGSDIVIIALSLANEGLAGSSSPDAILNNFKTGLAQIIARCRQNGYYPVTGLAYPCNNYSSAEYGHLKKMNLLLNTWDVPSINVLGALDDGSGRWAAGYWNDALHPNGQGHGEMFYAMVPSLFDAIKAGKTASPAIEDSNTCLRLQRDSSETSPLRFTPSHTMHSFTLSFRVRSREPGTIAAVGAGTTRATLEIRDNSLVYIGPGGAELSAPMDANNGHWHDIALSHRFATGKSLLFIDGVLKGSANDQYIPDLFVLGGPAGAPGRALAPAQADYQDLCIYRAAWTPDEAMAQHMGALQQASLEICAPLADDAPVAGTNLENRAQSLSRLTLNTGNFTASVSTTAPDGLAADSFSAGTASLTWTDHATGANEFTIERRRSGVTEPWTTAGTSPGSSPSFEDNGLVPGVSYDYRVSSSEGTLQSDYSNVVSIIAGGQSARSYQDWITGYFTGNNPTYLIDFNINASHYYNGITWNTVNSLNNPTPYLLADSNNNSSAGYTLTVSDSFDQFRSDNGAPLADFPADAQNTLFALRDDVPLTGSFTFAGLDPATTYDFTFLARRGTLVPGFDYSGTYTFTGSGPPVVVQVDAASNTALTTVSAIAPTPLGVITLKVSAGLGTGQDFPVINFIQMTRGMGDQTYHRNIRPTSDPDGDGFTNLEEYARNLDPARIDNKPFTLEKFGRKASGTEVELVATKDRRARDVRYVLEKSADLTAWEVDQEATTSVQSRVGAIETTTFTSPANARKRFFRIRMDLSGVEP